MGEWAGGYGLCGGGLGGSWVISRRRTSRNVVLTAAFLALAAGGVAACDSPSSDDDEPNYWAGNGDYSGGSSSSGDDSGSGVVDDSGEGVVDDSSGDEVFYCADAHGAVVDEDRCDGHSSSYFLWHSAGYARGLRPGSRLHGGDHFPAGDRKARGFYHLPATGRVGNGTVKTNAVKTNVVGHGSKGSSTSHSGSGGG